MFLVVNIGCIECGVSSKVVGLFADEVTALEIAQKLDERMERRQDGHNSFEVFPLPKAGVVEEEYRDALMTLEGTVQRRAIDP